VRESGVEPVQNRPRFMTGCIYKMHCGVFSLNYTGRACAEKIKKN